MRYRPILRMGLARQPQIPTRAPEGATMTGPQIIYALILILLGAWLISRL